MDDAYAEALAKHYWRREDALRTLTAVNGRELPSLHCDRCGVVAIDPKSKTIPALREAMALQGWRYMPYEVAEDWCHKCANDEYGRLLKARREANEVNDGC